MAALESHADQKAAMVNESSWRDVIISRRESGAEGIIILDLAPPDGDQLQSFSPGAHIDVEVAPGLVRQYSLCGNPRESGLYRIAILLEPASRGGSVSVHSDFTMGRRIRIGQPRNLFPLSPEAGHNVLVAGGIGITPLLSMAYHLQAQGESFELHYCAREPSRAAFLELLADSFVGKAHLHFSNGGEHPRFDPKLDLGSPEPATHVYICGPAGFMKWVISAALAAGWAPEQLHTEYFAAELDNAGGAFTVQTRDGGKSVRVNSGQTIAAALAEAGIDVAMSCEQGICGTCLVGVLAGVPDHRDVYQTDEEKAANTHIACCCSRVLSDVLVLDI